MSTATVGCPAVPSVLMTKRVAAVLMLRAKTTFGPGTSSDRGSPSRRGRRRGTPGPCHGSARRARPRRRSRHGNRRSATDPSRSSSAQRRRGSSSCRPVTTSSTNRPRSTHPRRRPGRRSYPPPSRRPDRSGRSDGHGTCSWSRIRSVVRYHFAPAEVRVRAVYAPPPAFTWSWNRVTRASLLTTFQLT